MDEYYMHEALKEAKKSYKADDVPVGAIIVMNNKIIAKAHNKKEKHKNAIEHAEILAISKACKKLNTWHLEKCTIYVTLEPCLMCAGALIQSRIGKLVYATNNEKFGYVESIDNILNDKKMKPIAQTHEAGFNDQRSLFQNRMKQASLDDEV